jgi:hypothetical protein
LEKLKTPETEPIPPPMTLSLLALYTTLAAVFARAVLVKLNSLPPSCARCGLPRERRFLGERICACTH